MNHGQKAWELFQKVRDRRLPHFIAPDEFWMRRDNEEFPSHMESYFCTYPFEEFSVSFESVMPFRHESGEAFNNADLDFQLSFSKNGGDIFLLITLFSEEYATHIIPGIISFSEHGQITDMSTPNQGFDSKLNLCVESMSEELFGVCFSALVKLSHGLISRSYVINEPSFSRQQQRLHFRKNLHTPRKIVLAPHVTIAQARRMTSSSRKEAIKVFRRAHPVRAHERIWEGKNGEVKVTTVRSYIRGGKKGGDGQVYDARKLKIE